MKSRKRPPITLIFLLLLAELSGCLPQPIEIDLPVVETQTVVEGYLQAGQNARVLVTETQGYLAPVGIPAYVSDARVIVAHHGVEDTLTLQGPIYESRDTLVVDYNEPYFLRVELENGELLQAETRFLEPVPLDSVRYIFDTDGFARVIFDFTDPGGQANYYRFIFSPHTSPNHFDLEANDLFSDGDTMSVGTRYMFYTNEFVTVSLYHTSKDYYDFLVAIRKAKINAQAPFSEPVSVQGNIEGGLGIFTTLNVREQTLRMLR